MSSDLNLPVLPRWGLAVEAAISLHLNAFLVHSMPDARQLRQMINQHFGGERRGRRPRWHVLAVDCGQSEAVDTGLCKPHGAHGGVDGWVGRPSSRLRMECRQMCFQPPLFYAQASP